jgi:hypothetical protein
LRQNKTQTSIFKNSLKKNGHSERTTTSIRQTQSKGTKCTVSNPLFWFLRLIKGLKDERWLWTELMVPSSLLLSSFCYPPNWSHGLMDHRKRAIPGKIWGRYCQILLSMNFDLVVGLLDLNLHSTVSTTLFQISLSDERHVSDFRITY